MISISIMLIFAIFFFSGIIPQTTLNGVVEYNEKPKREFKTIMNGKYQTEYSNWFSDNFPFRTYIVKMYDEVMFNTHSIVNGVKAGKNGDLFGEYFTRQSLIGTLDKTQVDNYARNLKFIQDRLEARGKDLIYIITPSKAEILPEDLPWNYRAAYDSLNQTANIRLELNTNLEDYGVKYIDYTDLMLRLKAEGEYPVFYRTGIHWSQYASSNATLELLKFIKNNTIFNTPFIKLSYNKIAKPELDEADYLALLNLYKSNYADDYYTSDIKLKEGEEPNLRVFSMSTSFSRSIMNLFGKSDIPFKYYWRSQYTQFQDKLYPDVERTYYESMQPGVAVNEMNFEEIVDQSDLIIIENNACELPQSHIDFVQALSEYLMKN
ncbi:alginate O-acetyltransferase AlgX-related protein [Lacrimispora sp. AGF001]|uniref:alginate O-acetyltransferase AlgX-related protein n=1 Tax=Lacrimispora sp. AGF001 TaxID=3401631 RepID=UPI003B42F2A9